MDSPLRAWLELQCQMIASADAGLVMLGPSEQSAAEAAHWPPTAPANPRLSATVTAARERGQPVAQGGEERTPPGGAPMDVAVPVTRGGRVVGAFGVSVRGLPPAESKALAGLLEYAARGLAMLLDARARSAQRAFRLSLAGSLLDHAYPAEAAHALASDLARALGCERVSVGLRRGRGIRLVAVSSNLRFVEQSASLRGIPAAMQEALEQDAVIAIPAESGAPIDGTREHEWLLRDGCAGAVCTVPMAARGRPVGALTFEWSAPRTPSPELRDRMCDAALLAGPILELMVRAESGFLERMRAGLGRWAERHLGNDHVLARGALVAAAALLLLVLAVLPGTYRISARASLEGRVQRALVAGIDGYVAEANARAGDLVREGDVLARLDDRDLQLERRKRQSEKAQLEKEYREALATRDRTQVSIVRARIEQAEAQLALVEEQLVRTAVVAPFDGVLLRGDLDRSLGSPVELGSVLFEVAPLDGYRIIVEVEGSDIADVAVGQTGGLALSALPGRRLPLVVERITPISTTRDGRSYFRVEASLEQPTDALRPGMEGVAKIAAGRRRLLWVWTHDLLDWLRLATWSLLP